MAYLPDLISRSLGGGNPAPSDFSVEVSRGRVRGVSLTNVRGLCPSVTGSMVELWQPGGSYDFPASGALLFVSSSDAADTATGAGAQSVLIRGVGADYSSYQELVSLSGTVPVATTGTFIRSNHAVVSGSGAHGSNRGAINVRHNATLLVAQIASGSGHDDNAIYTIADGQYGVIRSINAFSGFDAIVRVRMMFRPGGSGSAWQEVFDIEMHQAQINVPTEPNVMFPPRTDFRMSGQVTRVGNVNSGGVYGGFTLMLFDRAADDLEPG